MLQFARAKPRYGYRWIGWLLREEGWRAGLSRVFRLWQREGLKVHVSNATKERMDAKIRELTPRIWGQSSSRCIEQLNIYLRGRSGYFRICTEENVYRLLHWDAHIR